MFEADFRKMQVVVAIEDAESLESGVFLPKLMHISLETGGIIKKIELVDEDNFEAGKVLMGCYSGKLEVWDLETGERSLVLDGGGWWRDSGGRWWRDRTVVAVVADF